MKQILVFLLGCVFLPALLAKETKKTSLIEIIIDTHNAKHRISPYINGLGLAYHSDTDDFIKEFEATKKFRQYGIGALRYPGGHKTSSFHWEEPWYPVYTDKYSPNLKEKLDKLGLKEEDLPVVNANYMDLDEFLTLANKCGAEPIVGINLKTGQLYDREKEQTAETIRMFKHIKEKGYKVSYYYLDNEIGNKNHQKIMTIPEYAGYINRLVPKLREIQPNAKFIVNIMGAPYSPKNMELMRLAGKNYDAVDSHYYWNWGNANWDDFLQQRPLSVQSKNPLPITAAIFNSRCKEMGMERMRLVSLEWNVGPLKEGETLSAYQCALIQSEMIGQFIQSDFLAATLWPFHWKAHGKVYPGRVFMNDDHEAVKPVKDIFTMYSKCKGANYIEVQTSSDDIVAHAAKFDSGVVIVYILNKSENSNDVALSFTEAIAKKAMMQSLYGDNLSLFHLPPLQNTEVSVIDKTASLSLAPWSFSMLQLKLK
ncbi:MAG: hypothetical protein KAS71_09890 [Bacteroidales bacterium]|nr:hypothetical protein [Bacteroidales bacterium]